MTTSSAPSSSGRSPLIYVVPGVTRPGTVCHRTVDFMTMYPTLCDLCGLKAPGHVQGKSIRALLADPSARWDEPAVTTYLFQNHTVRTEKWRYIRYANGDEELYDETNDPNEWTNLAGKPEYTAKKAELAKMLPKTDHADIGPAEGKAKAKAKGKAKAKAKDGGQ